MKVGISGKAKIWSIFGGLLLLMSVTSVGYTQVIHLSEAEISWLTYMREEEKLARDVYLFLYEMYGSRIFNNISASEQTHMDAIKTLLDRYGIEDPAAGKEEGKFTNPGLQSLYDALVRQGSVSLIEAIRMGVLFEETDIEDLAAGLASTKRRDIKTVYSNLLQGSLNHLDAFCSNLARFGEQCQ